MRNWTARCFRRDPFFPTKSAVESVSASATQSQNSASFTAIRLTPLPLDTSRALLAGFFGPAGSCLPSHLQELIVTRAGGNPYYLEEIVRGLIEAGLLTREQDGSAGSEGPRWRCTGNVATLEVPDTVQGLLLARLDRVTGGQAAVGGQPERIPGAAEDEVSQRLVAHLLDNLQRRPAQSRAVAVEHHVFGAKS